MARGRMTFGLYNSYDPVKFAEAHRRAIARAAPVALAFDANVATFGFPFERELRTPQQLAAWVSETTSIGEEGKYLRELAEAGRLLTFDFPSRGFPPQPGEVVVMTTRPDAKKGVDAAFPASLLERGTSFVLVFGLGPPGLDARPAPDPVRTVPHLCVPVPLHRRGPRGAGQGTNRSTGGCPRARPRGMRHGGRVRLRAMRLRRPPGRRPDETRQGAPRRSPVPG